MLDLEKIIQIIKKNIIKPIKKKLKSGGIIEQKNKKKQKPNLIVNGKMKDMLII